jgi:serine/threonine protein kinase
MLSRVPRRLERGPLPDKEVLALGAQIADALDKAHRAGVVHRDLKPGNIMLTAGGAKLMDFGLARAAGLASAAEPPSESPALSRPLTAEGTIVGTFQYMAPEQLEGKETDARSDIWALGCVLYEMATGRRAFEGDSQASLITAASVLFVARGARRAPEPALARFAVTAPRGATVVTDPSTAAISPDGKTVAFTAIDQAGASQLWIRRLGSLSAEALRGTENAFCPFWSTDSRFLAAVPVDGAAPPSITVTMNWPAALER